MPTTVQTRVLAARASRATGGVTIYQLQNQSGDGQIVTTLIPHRPHRIVEALRQHSKRSQSLTVR